MDKEEIKQCRVCLIEKSIELFGKRKRSRDGRNHICKECFNLRYNIQNRAKGLLGDYNEMFRKDNIMKINQEDIRNAEIFQMKNLLSSIGYDFDSELSIHEQFMLRHNLK